MSVLKVWQDESLKLPAPFEPQKGTKRAKFVLIIFVPFVPFCG
jgi:hypothetical protein